MSDEMYIVEVAEDAVCTRDRIFHRIFFWCWFIFLGAFVYSHGKYFLKEYLYEQMRNERISKSEQSIEFKQYDVQSDEKYLKPLPDFIVDEIPNDELESLKP